MLAIAIQGSARADDSCLAKPGATTPRGGHWHYRVEAGTKRHCWYLGEQRGRAALETAAKPSPSAPASDKPAMTSSAPPLRPSITNAHAEFDGATSANDPADANSLPKDSSDEPSQNASISQPTATTQWPDPAINAVPVVNATQPPVQAAVTSGPQAPDDPPVPAATIEPAKQTLSERSEPSLASAVVSAPPEAEIQSDSSSMLLGGLAGALALAGFFGFAAFKFGNLSSLLHVRHSRLIEDLVDHDCSPPWERKAPDTAQTPRSDVLRIRQEIEAQSRDIMEILSRASRGATT